MHQMLCIILKNLGHSVHALLSNVMRDYLISHHTEWEFHSSLCIQTPTPRSLQG